MMVHILDLLYLVLLIVNVVYSALGIIFLKEEIVVLIVYVCCTYLNDFIYIFTEIKQFYYLVIYFLSFITLRIQTLNCLSSILKEVK